MANEIIKKYGIAILITIGIAIIGISSTYAYFATSMNGKTDGGPDFIASATTSSSNITLNTIRSINATDRKPGYNDVMAFSVISASNTTFDVNMVANSTIETPISYTVYKTISQVNVSNSCENVSDTINSQYSENCSITNIGSLGDSIASGTITNNTSNYVLLSNQEASSTIVYYYVVFTYPNANASQDRDFFKSLNVSIEIDDGSEEIEYVNYSVTYTGLPESYSSAHNIVNQSVEKGTSVTIYGADVEGYTLKEIIVVGNEQLKFVPEYELETINVILEIDTEITLVYEAGEQKTKIANDNINQLIPAKVSLNSNSSSNSGSNGIITPTNIQTPDADQDDDMPVEVNASGPMTLTFDVSGKAGVGDLVKLMHYVNGNWQQVGSNKNVDETLEVSWTVDSYSPYDLMIYRLNDYKAPADKYKIQSFYDLFTWVVNGVKNKRFVYFYDYNVGADHKCLPSKNNCVGYYSIESYPFSNNPFHANASAEEQIDFQYGIGAYQEIIDFWNNVPENNRQTWINSHALGYMYSISNSAFMNLSNAPSEYEVLVPTALTKLYGEIGKNKYMEYYSIDQEYRNTFNDSSNQERAEKYAIIRDWLNTNWIRYIGYDTPSLASWKVVNLADYYYLQAMKQQGYTNDQILEYVNQGDPSKYDLAQIVIDMDESQILESLDEVTADMLDKSFGFK